VIVNSERIPPRFVSAWQSDMRPICVGTLFATSPSSHAAAPGPPDLVLGERRQVDDPDPLAQHPALVADVLEVVAAPETPDVARLDAGRREPVGTLPAIALAEHAPMRFSLS
jgi:hypothetical protein